MARQALTVIGAVVGGIIGGAPGAQLGMAIGGAIGGLVDPEVIKVPSVRDAATQTANEGAPIALYDGACGGAGTLVYVSEPRFITVRQRQGGKGGPVVESERGLLTYAILIGAALQDGPGHRHGIKKLVKVWEDDKLVYDVSPTSEILAESAKYSTGFTFYPGNETQLPDPDLEALLGTTKCVAYRGRALFVRKDYDATDRRLTPPVHKFEVATEAEEYIAVSLATDVKSYAGGPDALTLGPSLGLLSNTNIVRLSPSGVFAAASGPSESVLREYDPVNEVWIDRGALPDLEPGTQIQNLAWSPNNQYLAATIDRSPLVVVWKRLGSTLSILPAPSEVPAVSAAARGLAWDSAGQRLAFSVAASDQSIYVYDFVSEVLANLVGLEPPGTNFIGGAPRRLEFMPGTGSRYLLAGNPDRVFMVRCTENPMPIAAVGVADGRGGVFTDASGGYMVAVGNGAVTVWEIVESTVGAEALNLESTYTTGIPANVFDADITSNHTFVAIAASTASPLTYPVIVALSGTTPPVVSAVATPPTTGDGVASVSFTGAPIIEQVTAGSTSFQLVTQAAGRRCGIPNDAWDLSEMANIPIRGVVVASQAYTGQDLVNGLRATFPSDGACFDGKIHILKRGGAVDFELDDDFRVEEGSDAEQDEVLRNGDDQRKAPLRRAAKINVMFPNANLGYTFTKANAPNYGAPEGVVTEVTFEVPVVLDEETEAPRVADILDKISRAEAEGELVRVFPDYLAAKAVPGSVLRLTDGNLQRRVRVQGIRNFDGTRRLSLWVDRAHAYVSQATAPATPGWPTPPPSLVGETTAAFFNLPAALDVHDMLGVYAAISGDPGTAWHGAQIEYRVQGMTAWTSLGTFTSRAVMGTLLAQFPAGSQTYPDTSSTLAVRLLHADDLESLSYVEWLSEMGALVILRPDGTGEIVQSRLAENTGSQDWALSEHQRGRLNTSAASHAAGARVAVFDTCLFLPLPSAVMGQTLEFRVTALGSTPESAPIHTLAWDPVLVQQEFPVAYLEGSRAGGTIACTWIERRRLGTDVLPVRSLNWEGYQVTLTDGSTTETFETTEASFSRSDAAFSGPVTVTVQQINRFTGPGPGTSLELS